ncbi:hypothetical protein [Streptomyces sp. NPDC059916]|uniref:hypothetical protein n=1 Tax=Streptomyces sp. NPDC059916 TaxID=3347001 RepID=UPI0036CC93CE
MGRFSRRSEAEIAATPATDKAARGRREGHRRSIPGTAAAGQAWEDADRARESNGKDRVTDWNKS